MHPRPVGELRVATPTPMPTADDDEVVVAAMMWMWRRMMDDKARSAHAKLVAAVRMMRRRPPRVVPATQARMVGCDGGSCSHSWSWFSVIFLAISFVDGQTYLAGRNCK